MLSLESKIEAILFFKNEPVTAKELANLLGADIESVRAAVESLGKKLEDRGIIMISDNESISLGTHPEASSIIETLQKEEFSRDLGRAGLETLSIILYKGPISRREIDHIRGVNSGFILRSLLIRGLIERSDASSPANTDRSYTYKATLKLLEHLGVSRQSDLPEYATAFSKIEEFVNSSKEEISPEK